MRVVALCLLLFLSQNLLAKDANIGDLVSRTAPDSELRLFFNARSLVSPDDLVKYNLTIDDQPLDVMGLAHKSCERLIKNFGLNKIKEIHCKQNTDKMEVLSLILQKTSKGYHVSKIELYHQGYDYKGSCVFTSLDGNPDNIVQECY